MKTLTQDQIKTLVQEFHTQNSEDIVGLFSVVQEVGDLFKDDDVVLEETLVIVKALLADGMVAGDPPYYPDGYRPWPDQDPLKVANRIRSEWLQLGHTPDIPDIVWFGPSKQSERMLR